MLRLILRLLRAFLLTRQNFVLENLALRHQLQVLTRAGKRPQIRDRDRLLWIFLSRIWRNWRKPLLLVQPETVIRWHRAECRAYWRFKSRTRRRGRPRLTLEERELIRRIARENPHWGAPRVHGELLKLGLVVSEATVAKYMRQRRPPSQSWKTFLLQHAKEIAAVDFFSVPTATMRSLCVFLVLSHDRRRILGFAITEAPSGAWAAEVVIRALDFECAPRTVLRDQDHKFGDESSDAMEAAAIRELCSAYRCPWQNGYVERVLGTIRRECLDHVIIFNSGHLRRVLEEYVAYYNGSRTHLGIEKDCPVPRAVEPPEQGAIIATPVLGGLHYRYTRRAA